MSLRDRLRDRIEALRERHRNEPDPAKKRSLWVWIQIAVLVAQLLKLFFVSK